MNREIPGFYYDPEKKKYFRIQANHVAPPGSNYSKDAVKKHRAEKRKYQEEAKASRRAMAEKIKRSRCLSHPLISVDREIGKENIERQMLEQQSRAYFSQLRRRRVHHFIRMVGRMPMRIADFVRDPRTGIFVFSSNLHLSSCMGLAAPQSMTKWKYASARQRQSEYFGYRLSSLSLSHSAFCLCTFDSGVQGDSFIEVVNMPDPEIHGEFPWPYYHAAPVTIPTSYGLWCSSSRPTGEQPFFAIGTSAGLNTLESTESDWRVVEHPPRRTHVWTGDHRAILSVEWISSDVVAAGQRDSLVVLYDMRSRDYATRLQHAHGVEKIRAIDSNKLMVGGHGTLSIYDIRFPVNGIQSKPRPNDANHTSTKPYLSFPKCSESGDFDISPEFNVLATSTTDNRLQLHSLRDASPLFPPSPITSLNPRPRYQYNYHHQRYAYPGHLSRIRFESGEYPLAGRQIPRLLVACDDVVDEWSWEGNQAK